MHLYFLTMWFFKRKASSIGINFHQMTWFDIIFYQITLFDESWYLYWNFHQITLIIILYYIEKRFNILHKYFVFYPFKSSNQTLPSRGASNPSEKRETRGERACCVGPGRKPESRSGMETEYPFLLFS
jgi:hypothetical protein